MDRDKEKKLREQLDLTIRDKVIMRLRFHGDSYKEIAKLLDSTPSRIKEIIKKAIFKLYFGGLYDYGKKENLKTK